MKKINFNGEELVLPETSDLATKAEVAIIKNDLDADIQDLQDQIDGISTDNLVDLETNQEISGVKTFKDNIGLKNADGTVDYLKHINNNFLISTSTGTNLMNIDEGLSKAYFFNKEVAYKEDVTGAGGTKVTVGGVVQDTFNADTKADVSALADKASQSDLNATNAKVNSNETMLNSLAVEVANAQQDISDNMADIAKLESDKANKTELPTKVSELENDRGFTPLSTVSALVDAVDKKVTPITFLNGGGISSNTYLPIIEVGQMGIVSYRSTTNTTLKLYLPSSGSYDYALILGNPYHSSGGTGVSNGISGTNVAGGSHLTDIVNNSKYTAVMVLYRRVS